MTQDTPFYYCVTFETNIVGRESKMIFRNFKDIEQHLMGTSNKIQIEIIPSADFDKQGLDFDSWRKAQEREKRPVIDDNKKRGPEDKEKEIDALAALKTSPQAK